jgi:hypothetical protein
MEIPTRDPSCASAKEVDFPHGKTRRQVFVMPVSHSWSSVLPNNNFGLEFL